VLFDEIEKAHQEVFNALLQLLDDGRLTDGHGRTVAFKNTVVIMTSNVGSQYIRDLAGDDAAVRDQVMRALNQHFRPEFLNRIDEVVIFHSLTREHLAQIVDIQLKRLQALLAERHITLELTGEAKRRLAEEGYDPVYGARPLKRVIQRRVQDPLALKLLQGDFVDGDAIRVDARNGQLIFQRETA
jgi:ATP-dependent Clp protease ATP-binding subunit ClpB